MKPPALRNFVPTEINASKPKPPQFFTSQQQFAIAPVRHFKEPDNTLSQLNSVPQPNPNRMMEPLRTINSISRPVVRGVGKYFDRSIVPAKPPRSFPQKELGFHEDRENVKAGMTNIDDNQRGVLVKTY